MGYGVSVFCCVAYFFFIVEIHLPNCDMRSFRRLQRIPPEAISTLMTLHKWVNLIVNLICVHSYMDDLCTYQFVCDCAILQDWPTETTGRTRLAGCPPHILDVVGKLGTDYRARWSHSSLRGVLWLLEVVAQQLQVGNQTISSCGSTKRFARFQRWGRHVRWVRSDHLPRLPALAFPTLQLHGTYNLW